MTVSIKGWACLPALYEEVKKLDNIDRISDGKEGFEAPGIDNDEESKSAAGDTDEEVEWDDEVQEVGLEDIGTGGIATTTPTT